MSASARHAELLRDAPGACLLLEDGVVAAANPEAQTTTGIPLGRLLGVPLAELLVADSQPPLHDLVAGAGDTTRSCAVRLAHSLAPLEVSVRRLADGSVVAGVRSMAAEHHYSALARGDLTHDPVTGLADRYHLMAQLQDRLTSSPRYALGLIGLWVDELPALAASDDNRAMERVVKEVASRLQARLRSPDILGRFDQSGFVTVLTSDAAPDQLTTIASRLRDEVAFPVELDDELVSFTATVAVASLGTRSVSIERILTKLDGVIDPRSEGNRTEVLDL